MVLNKILSGLIQKVASVPLFGPMNNVMGIFQGLNTNNPSSVYQGWVYACINKIKDAVASIELNLYQIDSKGNKELLLEHPVLTLLHDVNPFFSYYEIFEHLAADLELGGNHYWLLEKDSSGKPIEIYPLHYSRMTVIPSPENYVEAYQYTLGEKVWIIPVENIIHFRTYNPNSYITGMSTIEAVRTTIETDVASKEYSKAFYQNGANPGVILEYPGSLNKDAIQMMKTQWDHEFKGFKKAYRTAVAAGGLKVHRMDQTSSDMQFIEQRKLNRDDILAMFGVPGIILGVNDSTVYASAKEAEKGFSKHTINPKLKRIEVTLNEFLLSLYEGEKLEFEYVSQVEDDPIEKTAYYTAGINNGWLSLNDVRRAEGLPELEDGEDVFLPISLTPYSRPVVKHVSEDVTIKSISQIIAGNVVKELRNKNPYGGKWTEEEFDRLGESKVRERDARTKKFTKKFFDLSKQYFKGQEERIIKNLTKENLKTVRKISWTSIFDKDSEVKIAIDLFTPLFSLITEEEGAAALNYIGLTEDEFSINTPSMRDFLKGNTELFAKTINAKTSEDIRQILVDGLDAGDAIPDLARRVNQYSGFGLSRSRMIARTETIRAQGQAETQAWKESGVVSKKVWYTALDERVCAECDIMHGKEVEIDKEFLDEDGVLAFGYQPYGDGIIDSPPLHPQCRCTMLPVVE